MENGLIDIIPENVQYTYADTLTLVVSTEDKVKYFALECNGYRTFFYTKEIFELAFKSVEPIYDVKEYLHKLDYALFYCWEIEVGA